MNKISTLISLSLGLEMIACSATASADVLARLKPGAHPRLVPGTTVAATYSLVPGLVRITLPSSAAFESLKAGLLATGAYQYIEQDRVRTKSSSSPELKALPGPPPSIPAPLAPPAKWQDDPKESLQYGVEQNGASQVWKSKGAIGNSAMVIAVLDSGIDYTHPDLTANLWRKPGSPSVIGYDFVNNTGIPWDDEGHGTHVAGIAAAVGGNGLGISGQCPRCAIMALKVLDSAGNANDSAVISALDFGLKNGASVFLMAWGGPDDNQALKDAVKAVSDAGKMIVVASGNDGEDLDFAPYFPAKYQFPGMVTVAGLYDSPPSMPFWTNYSATYTHLSSAGDSVYSTWPGGGWVLQSGTSMAAAQVAGSAALVWSYRPALKATDVVNRLKTVTSDPDSATKTVFGGRPDLVTIFSQL